MKRKQRFLVYTQYVFDGVIRCCSREQGGSTAESPSKLWVGYGWQHSQHFAR